MSKRLASRLGLMLVAAAASAAIGLAIVKLLERPDDSRVVASETRGASGKALIGGAFNLTDHTGTPRSAADFRGKSMLVFFGYTTCPDVCPIDLMVMTEALDLLGDDADGLVPVFITIDPARDTVPVMRDYVSNFHPRLVGLTGTDEQIAEAAKAYRVYYAKAEQGGDADDYLMDHSAITYLMGADGDYLTHFTHNTSPEEMAERLRKYL